MFLTSSTQPYWVKAGADTVILADEKPTATHHQATSTVRTDLHSAATSRLLVSSTPSYWAEADVETRTLAVAPSILTVPSSTASSHPKTSLAFNKKTPTPIYVSSFDFTTTVTGSRSSTPGVTSSDDQSSSSAGTTTEVATTEIAEQAELNDHGASGSTPTLSSSENDSWVPVDCFTHHSTKDLLYIQALIRYGESGQETYLQIDAVFKYQYLTTVEIKMSGFFQAISLVMVVFVWRRFMLYVPEVRNLLCYCSTEVLADYVVHKIKE